MSTETIYKCDRTQGHSYSYERSSGETRTPIEDGWISVQSLNDPNAPSFRVERFRELREGDKHFCSHKCLAAFLEKGLGVIGEEEEESPEIIDLDDKQQEEK